MSKVQKKFPRIVAVEDLRHDCDGCSAGGHTPGVEIYEGCMFNGDGSLRRIDAFPITLCIECAGTFLLQCATTLTRARAGEYDNPEWRR